MTAVRSLHVDIEGGFGGSSRSLFELLSRLDRAEVCPLVAYREQGPAVARYRAIGVDTVHVAEIASYVPRARKAVKNLAASLPRLVRIERAAAKLAEAATRHRADVVHFNYEGLFLLAAGLRRRTRLPFVFHCRAELPESRLGAWVARSVARLADHVLFISPREEARFRALAGELAPAGEVMWNIATLPASAGDGAPEQDAVYLGSLDPEKGTDRLVEIAAALETMAAPPLSLAVYGRARAHPAFAARLERDIRDRGLGARIRLCGHTDQPEAVLARALALIRPSRTDDPWGRDVIEATRLGVPVLATGSYDGVVEPGITGFLFEPFEAEAMAATLIRLATEPALWQRLSRAATAKGEALFAGGRQARRMTEILHRLAGRASAQAVAPALADG